MSGTIDHANLTLKLDVPQLSALDRPQPSSPSCRTGPRSSRTGPGRAGVAGLLRHAVAGRQCHGKPGPGGLADQRVRRHGHLHEDR